mmetsp:Transcript_33877/g.88159  ORF Transcript_33877/g.88159 Transcript_33877/m.88159 type:complete len:380 (+) Transcript_33877:1214-2353(+)
MLRSAAHLGLLVFFLQSRGGSRGGVGGGRAVADGLRASGVLPGCLGLALLLLQLLPLRDRSLELRLACSNLSFHRSTNLLGPFLQQLAHRGLLRLRLCVQLGQFHPELSWNHRLAVVLECIHLNPVHALHNRSRAQILGTGTADIVDHQLGFVLRSPTIPSLLMKVLGKHRGSVLGQGHHTNVTEQLIWQARKHRLIDLRHRVLMHAAVECDLDSVLGIHTLAACLHHHGLRDIFLEKQHLLKVHFVFCKVSVAPHSVPVQLDTIDLGQHGTLADRWVSVNESTVLLELADQHPLLAASQCIHRGVPRHSHRSGWGIAYLHTRVALRLLNFVGLNHMSNPPDRNHEVNAVRHLRRGLREIHTHHCLAIAGEQRPAGVAW